MINSSAKRLVVVAATLFASACQPKAATPGSGGHHVDTLQGIISMTGTSFEKAFILRPRPESIRLLPLESDSAALARIGGVEVEVHGIQTPAGFNVVSFRVVRVGGKEVYDGTLIAGPTGLTLQVDGRNLRLGNPPLALQSMIGARIWLEGSLANGPNTYGVIAPKAER